MRFGDPTGAFEISTIPGQSQIAHTHSLFVPTGKRGMDHGMRLKQLQNETLAMMAYDYAICTVDGANAAQKRILTNSGWEFLTAFDNRRTGGITEIWGHVVKPIEGPVFSEAQQPKEATPCNN